MGAKTERARTLGKALLAFAEVHCDVPGWLQEEAELEYDAFEALYKEKLMVYLGFPEAVRAVVTAPGFVQCRRSPLDLSTNSYNGKYIMKVAGTQQLC